MVKIIMLIYLQETHFVEVLMKYIKKFKWLLLFCILLSVYIIIGFTRTELEVTEYTYSSTKLPREFDGYKIVHLSDLHHKNFGENQSELIELIKAQEPDLILLTGDIVDKKHTDMSSVENLFKGIEGLAPVYCVTGNHELDPQASNQYYKLRVLMDKYGVIDIDDDFAKITEGDSSIFIHGQKFRSYYVTDYLPKADAGTFNILMYHCSDYFDLISDYGYDIILSGHSHGGIVRLPFVGGVFGNSGDYFPDYAGGVFKKDNCTLFANRGLGDAKIPRFYNPPEIISITLKCQ